MEGAPLCSQQCFQWKLNPSHGSCEPRAPLGNGGAGGNHTVTMEMGPGEGKIQRQVGRLSPSPVFWARSKTHGIRGPGCVAVL
jgi:hypothetical protein